MDGEFIPITAIVGAFSVPIIAIVMDYRRRKLQFEERRAMIERGMQPPPLEDMQSRAKRRFHPDLVVRRERSLFTGVSMLFLGIGLGVGAWLLQTLVTVSFIPKGVVGPMTVGSAVVLCVGLGNLVYFAVTAKQVGERTQ
jgi:hypothetical protein